jgi:hypothetical protein
MAEQWAFLSIFYPRMKGAAPRRIVEIRETLDSGPPAGEGSVWVRFEGEDSYWTVPKAHIADSLEELTLIMAMHRLKE